MAVEALTLLLPAFRKSSIMNVVQWWNFLHAFCLRAKTILFKIKSIPGVQKKMLF